MHEINWLNVSIICGVSWMYTLAGRKVQPIAYKQQIEVLIWKGILETGSPCLAAIQQPFHTVREFFSRPAQNEGLLIRIRYNFVVWRSVRGSQ